MHMQPTSSRGEEVKGTMTVRVGEPAPETGRYAHTASGCPNTIILNKGNIVPPCSLSSCKDKGAPWKLVAKLT